MWSNTYPYSTSLCCNSYPWNILVWWALFMESVWDPQNDFVAMSRLFPNIILLLLSTACLISCFIGKFVDVWAYLSVNVRHIICYSRIRGPRYLILQSNLHIQPEPLIWRDSIYPIQFTAKKYGKRYAKRSLMSFFWYDTDFLEFFWKKNFENFLIFFFFFFFF